MEVKHLSPDEASKWDGFVSTRQDGTPFHLTAWSYAMADTFGHKAYLLYVEDEHGVQGVLPLMHVKSLLFGNALISGAFAVYGGPLSDRADVHKALDEEAGRLRLALGASYIEYRNQQPLRPGWPVKAETYATFKRPIDSDPDVNMKAIPRKQRAMVRKAIGFGLTPRIDEDCDTHFALYSESLRNLGTPAFPKKMFQALKRNFGDACDILTVMHGEKPIASVMSFYFQDQVLPYFGGGGPDARTYAANDYMYWALMEHAREKGCNTFDFGRSKVGTGAYAFKKNWGFEPQPLHYEYMLADGETLPDINPLNPKYQLMIKVWRKLPLPVANRLGPFITRGLG